MNDVLDIKKKKRLAILLLHTGTAAAYLTLLTAKSFAATTVDSSCKLNGDPRDESWVVVSNLKKLREHVKTLQLYFECQELETLRLNARSGYP